MKRLFLVVVVILLLASVIVSCTSSTVPSPKPAPQPTAPPSSPAKPPQAYMTEQQVISLVQVYGVPAMGQGIVALGNWSAFYEGDGRWRVRGQVRQSGSNGDFDYSTTWLYNGQTISAIDVVLISSPTPAPTPAPAFIVPSPATTPAPTRKNPALCQHYLETSKSYRAQAEQHMAEAEGYLAGAERALSFGLSDLCADYMQQSQEYADRAAHSRELATEYYTRYLECLSGD